MLSPQKFANQVGLSYAQVLVMCKKNEISCIETRGGHYKIPEKELDKFKSDNNYISKENYEDLLRENERLKTELKQVQSYVSNIQI